jgi:hypothetical protein
VGSTVAYGSVLPRVVIARSDLVKDWGGVAVRYGYQMWGRVKIRGFADVESGDNLTFSPIFDKKIGIAL